MSSLAIRLIVFACIFGAALLGLFLRGVLPEKHLRADSKDAVRLGMGMIATMAALVLGLLVASAKNFFDTQSSELTQLSANVILLDRVLAHFGPETKEARDLLRGAVARTLNLWHRDLSVRSLPLASRRDSQMAPTAAGGSEILYDKIQALSPTTDVQRTLKAQASSMAVDLGKLRWLMFEQGTTGISVPLLVVLVFWLAIVFTSFGLFAPPNATVVATLFLCALSVSGAIWLILEMYTPFQGVLQISSAPLHEALARLGK
jgi:hypothetical protein